MKNSFILNIIFCIALGILSHAQFAFADDYSLILTSQPQKSLMGSELVIDFESVESLSGQCPLIVHHFEFEEDVKIILIDVEREEPCLIENYGKVRGVQKWMMPSKLLAKNTDVLVVINGKSAGKVSIQDRKVKLVPSL